ncbi:MAG: hypothetical protein M3P18_20350, partial [Actinomycetota bacterium]|nr:hypothetical protein [Actinomycetota bacterium]
RSRFSVLRRLQPGESTSGRVVPEYRAIREDPTEEEQMSADVEQLDATSAGADTTTHRSATSSAVSSRFLTPTAFR